MKKGQRGNQWMCSLLIGVRRQQSRLAYFVQENPRIFYAQSTEHEDEDEHERHRFRNSPNVFYKA